MTRTTMATIQTETKGQAAWAKRALVSAALMAALAVGLPTVPAYAQETFTVNNNGDQPDLTPDDGLCVADTFGTFECTLRAAIQQANATPGADRINFNLDFQTIRPNSQLPVIRNQTTIDGYTQPFSSPNTLQEGDNAAIRVELDGTNAGSASGLVFSASGSGDSPSSSVVQGLAINDFARDGVSIFGGLGIRIEGNFIGTDTSGTEDQGNGGDGVLIREGVGDIGGLHVVGDGSPASRNVISGNAGDGVSIFNGPSNNRVQGNYIGTDRDGTDNLTNDDMGNDSSGVSIFSEADNNEIGGTTAGQGNVISNSDRGGIVVSSDASGNKVLGNRIGTDRNGTKDLGNGDNGVFVLGAADNLIGDGTAGGANTIAFSDRAGVQINEEGGQPDRANGNRILSNSIFSNGDSFPGIALNNDGVTPNDPGDADTGANRLQNFPMLTSAKTAGLKTTIKGKLNSEANTAYVVQFFSNPRGIAPEGKKFIGQKIVTTDLSGNVSFTFKAKKVAKGQRITATATRNFFGIPSSTSEFSAPRKVAVS